MLLAMSLDRIGQFHKEVDEIHKLIRDLPWAALEPGPLKASIMMALNALNIGSDEVGCRCREERELGLTQSMTDY